MPLTRIGAPPQGLFLSIAGLRGNALEPSHVGLLAVAGYSLGLSARTANGSVVPGYASDQLTLSFDTDQGLSWFLHSALSGTNISGTLFGGGTYGLSSSYLDTLTLSLSQARVESVVDYANGGFSVSILFSTFDYQARDLQGNGLLAPANRFGSNNLGTDLVLSPAPAVAAAPQSHTGVPTHFYFTANGLAGPLSGGGLTNLFAADVNYMAVSKYGTASPTVSMLTVTLSAGEEAIDGILSKVATRANISLAEVLGYSDAGQVYKLSITNAHIATVDLSKPGEVTLTLDFAAATWRTIDVDDAGRPVRFDSNTANLTTNIFSSSSGTITSIPADFTPVAAITVASPDRYFVSVPGWQGDTASGLHAGLFEAAIVGLPRLSNSGTGLSSSDLTLNFATQDGAARFLDAMAGNATLPTLTVYESASAPGGLSDVFQFDIANARVTSVTSQGGATGVTLSFTAFEATAFPQAANGTIAAPVRYGFDLSTRTTTTVADAPISNAVAPGHTVAPITYYITIPGITGNYQLQFQNAGTANALVASDVLFGGARVSSGLILQDLSVVLPEGLIYLPKLADWAVRGLNLTGAKLFGYSDQGLTYQLDLSGVKISQVTPASDGSVYLSLTPTQYAVHVFDYGAGPLALVDESSGYNRTGSVATPYTELTPLDQSSLPSTAPTVTLAAPERYYFALGGWTGDSDSALHPGLFEITSPYLPSISRSGNTPLATEISVQLSSFDGLANFVGALLSNTHYAQAGVIGSGLFGGVSERDALRVGLTDVSITSVQFNSGGYFATIAYRAYDLDTRGLSPGGNLVTVVPHQGYDLAANTIGGTALSAALNSQPTDGSNNAMPTIYFLQLNGVSGTFSTADTTGLLPILNYSFSVGRSGSSISGGNMEVTFNSSLAADADLLRLMTDATAIGQGHILGYNTAGQVFDLSLGNLRISNIQSANGATAVSIAMGSFSVRTVDLSAGGAPVRAQTTGYDFSVNTVSTFTQTTVTALPAPAGPLNRAPNALADSYVLDGSASIGAAAGLLANDSDPDANALLAPVITSAPLHGVINLRADGSFDYTTSPEFSGYDSFQYQVSDAFGATSAPVAANLTVYLAGATAGNDVITGTALADLMRGLGGNDILSGGGGNDSIDGGTGTNLLYGGAGDDRLIIGTGANGTVVDGGADFDTLVVTGTVALGGLSNIEAIELQGGAVLSLTGAQLNSGLAIGTTLAGTGSIMINMAPEDLTLSAQFLVPAPGSSLGITINGSSSSDIIKGVIGAVNTIEGGAGDDQIRGGALGDIISGGDGNDKLFGANGPDILTGGLGADQFRFQTAQSSGLNVMADQITDFLPGTDKLAFRLLDSDPAIPGIQGFSYIGTQIFHANGSAEIRYGTAGANLLVQLDLNGDGVVDMEVVLQGLAGQALSTGDFLL